MPIHHTHNCDRALARIPLTITAFSVALATYDMLPSIGLPRDVYYEILIGLCDGRREVADFMVDHWRHRVEFAIDQAVKS